MANMNLVTGYAGAEHVTAADHGSLFAALFGSGQYVLDKGNKFAATKLSNNSVRVASGDALINGRHCRIDDGLYVDLSIESGTAGYLRNDLVCIRYTKNDNTGVEETNLVILRGNPVAASPADPAHTAGDILNGALTAEFPLYRLCLNGVTLETIEPLNKGSFLNYDAFCKALEAYKTEIAAEFEALQAAISANVSLKAQTGQYTGTGTYGSSNQNSLTFDFPPKIVIVVDSQSEISIPMIMISGYSTGNGNCIVSWSGNTVSWYTSDNTYGGAGQCNRDKGKYPYIAIG